ncbi:MAG: LytTR family transcriptional regulator [Treponema sp.]|nr:LytTR family transcriptional regulator [Treponema sp.]
MKIEILEGFDNIEVIIKCPKANEDIRKIESLIHGFDKKLPCFKNGVTKLINKRDVLYFESVDKHCFLYTKDDVFETSLKLYEIEELLTDVGFFRSSKSQILNLEKIDSLCPDFGGKIEAIMENGYQLIVSRQYAKILKEKVGLK